MDAITDKLTEWIKEMIIHGIMGCLLEIFDTINMRVGEIATEVGKTPSAWHGGVFSMIQNLSETVMLPIAGLILTYVMVAELINMIIDRNNFHDFPPSDIFKWVFKTAFAVLLVSNVFPFTMAVFDVSQSIVNDSAGIIMTDTEINPLDVFDDMWDVLEDQSVGNLLMIYVQCLLLGIGMDIMSICIFIVIYGRMIEIYMVTSLAPIPFATLMSKEQGSVGQNYIKSLIALGLQAFLIMVCVGIYAVMIQSIAFDISDTKPMSVIWTCMGYTVLLCFTLFKTGSIAKSVLNAH